MLFVSSFAAGEQGAIHAFQLHLKTGGLQPVHTTTGVENPFFLAVSPDQKFLFSTHAENFGGTVPEQLAAYAIMGRSGQLQLLNRQSAQGTAACYLDIDATGKCLLVANYSSGSVASLPVHTDGTLGEAASLMQHAGSSVNSSRQKEPHAHSFVVSPDNRFAFAADLGIDQILCYRLDSTTARLTPNRQPFARTPPGAGPRHLTFDPAGKRMYVINELSNSVTVYDYVGDSGLLIEQQTISTLPADFHGESYCADLKITPNGKFLYGTNRGHDSLAAYRIGDDGRPTLIAIEPSRGKGPQNLLITPDGQWLLCANMPGNNLAVFKIDAESGNLQSAGDPVTVTRPSCIRLLK